MSEPFVHWDDDDVPKLSIDRIVDRFSLERRGDGPAQEGSPSLEELQQRYPRTVLELRVLECLRRMAPLALGPHQLSLVLHVEVQEIRTILTALKQLEVIEHPRRGLYCHRPV